MKVELCSYVLITEDYSSTICGCTIDKSTTDCCNWLCTVYYTPIFRMSCDIVEDTVQHHHVVIAIYTPVAVIKVTVYNVN